MNFEIDVNGITVSFNMSEGFDTDNMSLHTLLRKGDACSVNDGGVFFRGKVENIIRLSNGKSIYSVILDNNPIRETVLFEDYQVSPLDPVQCALRLTAIDVLLKKYEPKGMSTNVSIWT